MPLRSRCERVSAHGTIVVCANLTIQMTTPQPSAAEIGRSENVHTERSAPNLDLAASLSLRGNRILRVEPTPATLRPFLIVFAAGPALTDSIREWEPSRADELRRFATLRSGVYRLLGTTRQLAGGAR